MFQRPKDYRKDFSSTPVHSETHVRKLFSSPSSIHPKYLREKFTDSFELSETSELKTSERTQTGASSSTSCQSSPSRIVSHPSFYTCTTNKRITLVDIPTPESPPSFGNFHAKSAKPLQIPLNDTKATRKGNQPIHSVKSTRQILNINSDESDAAENLDVIKPKSLSKTSIFNSQTVDSLDDAYEEFLASFSQAHASLKFASTLKTSGLSFTNSKLLRDDTSGFKESSRIGTSSTPANKKRFTVSTEPVNRKISRSVSDRARTLREFSQKVKFSKETQPATSKDPKVTLKGNQSIRSVEIPRGILNTDSDESDVGEILEVLEPKALPKRSSLYCQSLDSLDDAYEEFVAGFSQANASTKIVNTFQTPGFSFSNSSQESCCTDTPARPANKKKFCICTKPVTRKVSRSCYDRIKPTQESSRKEKLQEATQLTLQSPKVLSELVHKDPARNTTSKSATCSLFDSSGESESEASLAKNAKASPKKLLKTSVAFFSASEDEILVGPRCQTPKLSEEKITSIASSSTGVDSSSVAKLLQNNANQGNSSGSSLTHGVERVPSNIESSNSASKTRLEMKRVTSAARESEEEGLVHAAHVNNNILRKNKSERMLLPTEFPVHSTQFALNSVEKGMRVLRQKQRLAKDLQLKAPPNGQSPLKSSKMANCRKSSSVIAEAGRRITRQNATKNAVPESENLLKERRILKEIPLQSPNGKHATNLENRRNETSLSGVNSVKQAEAIPMLTNNNKRYILLRNRVVLLTPPESRENSVSRSSNSSSAYSFDGSGICNVGIGDSPCNGVVGKAKVSQKFKTPEPANCKKRNAASVSTYIGSEQAVTNSETSTPGKPVHKKPRVVKLSHDLISQAIPSLVPVITPLEASLPSEEYLNVTSSLKYYLRSRSLVSPSRVSKRDLRSNRSLSAATRLENKSQLDSESVLFVSLPKVAPKEIRENQSAKIGGRLMLRTLLDEKLTKKRAVVLLDPAVVDQWQIKYASKSLTGEGVESEERPTRAETAMEIRKQRTETSGNQTTIADLTLSTFKCSRTSVKAKETEERPKIQKKRGRPPKALEKTANSQEAPKIQKKRGRPPKAPEKISPPTFEGPPKTVKERQQVMQYLIQKEEQVKVRRTDAIYGRMEEWADVLQSKMEVSDTSSLRTPTTPCSSFVGTPARLSESEDERRRETPLIVRNTAAEVTKFRNVQMIHKTVKEREKQARNVEKEEKRNQKLREAIGPARSEEIKNAYVKDDNVDQENEDGYVTDDEDDLVLADQRRNFSPPKVAKKLFYEPKVSATSVPRLKENDRSSGNLKDMRQVVEQTIKSAKIKRRKFKYSTEYKGSPLEVTAYAVTEDEDEEKEFSSSESDA